MCLDRLKKFKVAPTHTDGSIKGWKAFKIRRRGLHGPYWGGKVVREWNIATSGTLPVWHSNTGRYERGYHIFTERYAAKRYSNSVHVCGKKAIVPVYYMPNDIVAKGSQTEGIIVVVKRMWIEPHDYDKAVGA